VKSSEQGSPGSRRHTIDWSGFDAVLFDLDGVITPTAEVHMRAWAEMFNEFLTEYAEHHADAPEGEKADLSPYTNDDPGSEPTVRGLGDRKNDAFNHVLERDGVTAYPGSVALLDHLRALGIPLAVVSSSANAPAVLAAAGVADRFATVVDGRVATELGLRGKPAPDTFVHAASALGANRAKAVVVEDAVSGVRAGRAGDFGLVVGVDRGAGVEALTEAGADIVVPDLSETVPHRAGAVS
jgi:HAD superfamily hydrolase (TIGR01509 family)